LTLTESKPNTNKKFPVYLQATIRVLSFRELEHERKSPALKPRRSTAPCMAATTGRCPISPNVAKLRDATFGNVSPLGVVLRKLDAQRKSKPGTKFRAIARKNNDINHHH